MSGKLYKYIVYIFHKDTNMLVYYVEIILKQYNLFEMDLTCYFNQNESKAESGRVHLKLNLLHKYCHMA